MGYYTDFELSFNSKDNNQVMESLGEISGYTYWYSFTMNGKWYKWQEDMKELSMLYPDVLFELSGRGEEPDDLWGAYFKGGKAQICKAKITFDKYDEDKME